MMERHKAAFARGMVLLALLSVLGCGGQTSSAPASHCLKSPGDPLASVDLDCLLAVVHSHGGGAIPEFTPSDEDRSLDYNGRAADLVSEIRGQLGQLFDARRQGEIWDADEKWMLSFSQHHVSGAEFAALVRSVSCAIMRVRLSARVDVEQLVTNARNEVKELVSTMDAIDEIPHAEQTRQDATIRGRSALSLARTVALLEFAEMIKQVPQENCALVRKYSKQLKPLLPPGGMDNLLSELQALGNAPRSDVVPAGHSTFDGE